MVDTQHERGLDIQKQGLDKTCIDKIEVYLILPSSNTTKLQQRTY
jgi:ArsR family metal-binding transcriptional regulator